MKALLLFTTLLSGALAHAETYKLDTTASKVEWLAKKVTGQHHGIINLKDGSVIYEKGALTGGEFTTDMTSIANLDIPKTDKDNAKLIGHLKSDDFFAVEKNPTSSFKIKSVKAAKGPGMFEVTGDLTIKGITQPVTFPAKISEKAGVLDGEATVTVDRTKYNIRYGSGKFFQGLGDKVIYDTFELKLKLIAKK